MKRKKLPAQIKKKTQTSKKPRTEGQKEVNNIAQQAGSLCDNPVWKTVSVVSDVYYEILNEEVLSKIPDEFSQNICKLALSSPAKVMSFVQNFDEAQKRGDTNPYFTAAIKTGVKELVSKVVPPPIQTFITIADIFGESLEKYVVPSYHKLADELKGDSFVKQDLHNTAKGLELTSKALRFLAKKEDRVIDATTKGLMKGAEVMSEAMQDGAKMMAEHEENENAVREQVMEQLPELVKQARVATYNMGEKFYQSGMSIANDGKSHSKEATNLSMVIGRDLQDHGVDLQIFGSLLKGIGLSPNEFKPTESDLSQSMILDSELVSDETYDCLSRILKGYKHLNESDESTKTFIPDLRLPKINDLQSTYSQLPELMDLTPTTKDYLQGTIPPSFRESTLPDLETLIPSETIMFDRLDDVLRVSQNMSPFQTSESAHLKAVPNLFNGNEEHNVISKSDELLDSSPWTSTTTKFIESDEFHRLIKEYPNVHIVPSHLHSSDDTLDKLKFNFEIGATGTASLGVSVAVSGTSLLLGAMVAGQGFVIYKVAEGIHKSFKKRKRRKYERYFERVREEMQTQPLKLQNISLGEFPEDMKLFLCRLQQKEKEAEDDRLSHLATAQTKRKEMNDNKWCRKRFLKFGGSSDDEPLRQAEIDALDEATKMETKRNNISKLGKEILKTYFQQQGISFYEKKEYKTAALFLETCRAEADNDHDKIAFGHLLANCYLSMDTPNAAEKQLQTSLQLDGNDLFSLRKLAAIRFQGLQLEQGIDYLERAVKIDPSNTEELTYLGSYYAHKGDHFKAIKYYETSLNTTENIEISFACGQSFLELGELEKAQEKFKQVASKNPNNINAWFGLAKISHKIGDYRSTIDYLINASSIDVNNSVIKFAIGDLYSGLNGHLQAAVFYEQGLMLDKNNQKAILACAISYFRSEHYEEAKEEFKRALINDPTCAVANFGLASISFKEGKSLRAEQRMKQAHSSEANHDICTAYADVITMASAQHKQALQDAYMRDQAAQAMLFSTQLPPPSSLTMRSGLVNDSCSFFRLQRYSKMHRRFYRRKAHNFFTKAGVDNISQQNQTNDGKMQECHMQRLQTGEDLLVRSDTYRGLDLRL